MLGGALYMIIIDVLAFCPLFLCKPCDRKEVSGSKPCAKAIRYW